MSAAAVKSAALSNAALRLDAVHVSIAATPILRGVTLEVGQGELVGLIGRNGAGKTTTMRTIVGLAKPVRGSVHIDGADVTKVAAYVRVSQGIGYMPEDRRLVPRLGVEENMCVPAWVNSSIDVEAGLAFIYELMPELHVMRERRALLLSGGQQKMVALGRALMAGSRLLLLDEPFEGVAPALARRLADVIAALREDNRSVLIAQSELSHAGSLFDREIQMERGEIER